MKNGAVRVYKNQINGKFVDSVSGKMLERINPVTGEVVSRFADSTEEDMNVAVAAAREAFDKGPWPRMTGVERSRILYNLARKIEQESEMLARIETEEGGKVIKIARGDIAVSIAEIDYAAGLAQQIHGESYNNLGEKYIAYTMREPIGVVGIIVPWNFPTFVFSLSFPFALAAGCTVVVKPASNTPGTAAEICRMAEEVGVPKGVINVVSGRGGRVGTALVQHPDVDRICFTGSTEVGKDIMRKSSETFKRVCAELGGKAAGVVFADADIDDAIDGTMFGIFYHQGEVCCATSRLLIEDSIADEFIAKLVERTKKLRIGDPMDEKTDITTMIDEAQFKTVMDYIEIGKAEGAKIVAGGKSVSVKECKCGYFIEPTIFDDVKRNMRIFQEEIFGPVLTVTRFKTVDEAIDLANDTQYGLANAVWTKDIDKAMIVSRALKSGSVWVNTAVDLTTQLPYGGYKESGVGRESGNMGMEEFTEVKGVKIHIGKRAPFYQV
jgi:betaine-aldehyde dehydrogenase